MTPRLVYLARADNRRAVYRGLGATLFWIIWAALIFGALVEFK